MKCRNVDKRDAEILIMIQNNDATFCHILFSLQSHPHSHSLILTFTALPSSLLNLTSVFFMMFDIRVRRRFAFRQSALLTFYF